MEQSVRALYDALLDAWNQQDAKAYAELFTYDASVIGFDGSQMNGPQEIRTTLAAIFADHPTARYVSIVREIRALSDTVALLRADAGMVPRDGGDLMPERNAIQSLVAVSHDGMWRIALFQNTPAAFHGRPEMVKALTEELRASRNAP